MYFSNLVQAFCIHDDYQETASLLLTEAIVRCVPVRQTRLSIDYLSPFG